MNKAEFFDRWAPSYDCLLPSVFYQAVHQRLLESVTLPAQPHVLEVGCGTGKLLNRLADRNPHLTGIGVDIATAMLAQATRKTPHRDRLQFQLANVENLPFADQCFDGVFCAISFLHYPDPVAALRSVARVLKPTGTFYLADFTPPKWSATATVERGITPGNVCFYTAQGREQLAADAGLVCDRHVYLLGPVMLSCLTHPVNC